MILIPYGPGFLQLRPDEYSEILARGLAPGPSAAPAQPPVAERWLTSQELAELTGIGDTWWEGAAKRGEVPHVRAGKALRFLLIAVTEVLDSRHADRRTVTRGELVDSVGQKHSATKKHPALRTGGRGAI